MEKIIITYKSDGYDFGEEAPSCEYCGASAEDTEIAENHVSGGFMCGEIECWNEYVMSQVWGRMVQKEEKIIEVCDNCEEEDCYCESEEDNEEE